MVDRQQVCAPFWVARTCRSGALIAIAAVALGCAPAVTWVAGTVTRVPEPSGVEVTRLEPVQLGKTWDGAVMMGLTVSSAAATAGFTVTRRGEGARYDACEELAFEDGESVLFDTPDVAYADDLEGGTRFVESLTVPVPMESVDALATAAMPAVRVCGDRFELEEGHVAYLREFVDVSRGQPPRVE